MSPVLFSILKILSFEQDDQAALLLSYDKHFHLLHDRGTFRIPWPLKTNPTDGLCFDANTVWGWGGVAAVYSSLPHSSLFSQTVHTPRADPHGLTVTGCNQQLQAIR